MQLQNFECQIAKAQIGRYLAGDVLADENLRQLEAHIATCPGCKQHLAERKQALQATLSEPQTSAKRFDLAEFIKAKVLSRQPVQAAVQTNVKPNSLTKPLLYSLALGIVLIGMSYLSKNMSALLGPKAAEAVPPHTGKPAAPRLEISNAPIGAGISEALADFSVPSPKPRPATREPKAPISKPHHKAPRPATNRVHIYALENGQ